MHADVRVQRAGGLLNSVMYTAGKLLIDNCTFSQNVAGDDRGGVVNATGERAAVLLNRVTLQNNTGQRTFSTSEGGTMYSTQPGLQYFDDKTSEANALTPEGPAQEGLFPDFADPWLMDTIEVRLSQSAWSN